MPELRGVVKPPKQRKQTETKKPGIANGGEDKETETEGEERMKQGREEEHDDEDNHHRKGNSRPLKIARENFLVRDGGTARTTKTQRILKPQNLLAQSPRESWPWHK